MYILRKQVGKIPSEADPQLMGDWRGRVASSSAGLPATVECALRNYGAELIYSICERLRVPATTAAGAAQLFQRFLCERSLFDHNVQQSAASSVLIALKATENPRRIHELLSVFWKLAQRRQVDEHEKCKEESSPCSRDFSPAPLDLVSRQYRDLKTDIVCTERWILRAVGFDMSVGKELPHRYLLQFCKVLGLLQPGGRRTRHSLSDGHEDAPVGLNADMCESFAQSAWNFANDAMRSAEASLCYSAAELACACMFLAARRHGITSWLRAGWWELFIDDTSAQGAEPYTVMLRAAAAIAQVYQLPQARYIDVTDEADVRTLVNQGPASAVGILKLHTRGKSAEATGADVVNNSRTIDAPELSQKVADESANATTKKRPHAAMAASASTNDVEPASTTPDFQRRRVIETHHQQQRQQRQQRQHQQQQQQHQQHQQHQQRQQHQQHQQQ